MILGAFGVVDYPPLQVSEALHELNMSHSIAGSIRSQRITYDGLSTQQPVWPVIVDSIESMLKVRTKRDRLVYFICDSRAALATTNIYRNLWPENRAGDLRTGIKNALVTSRNLNQWTLTRDETTITDYVNIATKPSILNDIQSAFYKINPYSLRRETQLLCIGYLSGYASFTEMKRNLTSNFKLERIYKLMVDERAKALRQATMMLSSMKVEEAAKLTGFDTFELLYISKSSAKYREAKSILNTTKSKTTTSKKK